MKKWICILLLAIAVGTLPLSAKEIFISPTSGKDTNAGTEAAPFQTPTKALAVWKAGDRIWLVGPNYKVLITWDETDTALTGTLPPTASSDVTKPTVKFFTPNLATFTTNDRTVNVGVADNIGVVRVELYRKGLPIPIVVAAEKKLPATTYLRWQASSIPKGTYTLIAIAYDAAGNASDPASIAIIRQ